MLLCDDDGGDLVRRREDTSPGRHGNHDRLTKSEKLVKKDVPGVGGVVQMNVHPKGEKPEKNRNVLIRAIASRDYIARAHFKYLKPGTTYVCETSIGADEKRLRRGPTATFRTLPGAKPAIPVKFVVMTGGN